VAANVLPCTASTLERILPGDPQGLVSLVAQPDAGVVAWSVEEQLPALLSATDISHGGSFDAYTGKVKWGPFTDTVSRNLAYRIIAPETAEVSLSGQVSWNGDPGQSANGPVTFVVGASSFAGWLVQTFGSEILGRPDARIDYDGDGDRIPLLAEFYFGLNPAVPDFPALGMDLDAQGILHLSLVRRASAVGLGIEFHRSEDLATWISFDPGQPLEVIADGELESVRYAFPQVAPNTHLRLQLGE